MRFKKAEYDRIISKIRSGNYNDNDFIFLKSKGTITIRHEITGSSYSFFREEKTEIDDSGRWVKSIKYYDSSRRKREIGSFEQLLTDFREWIDGMDR